MFGGQDCLCGKWGLKRTSARPDLLTFTVCYHHFTANSSLPLDTSRAQGKTWRALLDPLVIRCLNSSVSFPVLPLLLLFHCHLAPQQIVTRGSGWNLPPWSGTALQDPRTASVVGKWCLCQHMWLDISNMPCSAVMIPHRVALAILVSWQCRWKGMDAHSLFTTSLYRVIT